MNEVRRGSIAPDILGRRPVCLRRTVIVRTRLHSQSAISDMGRVSQFLRQ
jgi:hypothetical protein